MNETERVKILRIFIIGEGLEGTQTFCTRNWVGDETEKIYDDNDVTVYYCPGYDYLEIIGLTYEEYHCLSNILNIED